MTSLALASMHVYPLKSGRGLSPTRHPVVERGFRFDRRWMLVDETGTFVTQRELPKMAFLTLHFELPQDNPTQMRVSAPGMEPLILPLEPKPTGSSLQVRVWKDTVAAQEAPPEAHAWVSRFLERPLRWVFMPDSTRRRVNPDYATPDDVVGFADGFPFLLISEGSLEALNARLAQPVPMSRFRPNLVIRGAEPFAEDTWKRVRIGDIELDVVKPCPRCVMTTVDEAVGKHAKEPLATLATFRNHPGKGVLFGQNLIHRGQGVLERGAPVTVLERR